MGYAARANLRSVAGGKPRAFVALHRLWRMVDFFQGDRVAFDQWLETRRALTPDGRAAVEELWRRRYPEPLVAL